MVVQSPYDADAMKRTLQDVRGTVDRITGLLVATRDGLVVCADTNGVENDAVAAMSAAASGLANQFTSQAKVGEPRASMFEGESGFVGVFPIEAPLLLVVFGERDTTMGLFNVAARQALSLVQQAIVRQRVQGVRRTRREFFEDDAEASGE
jgi:hypothetical protein